MSTVLDDAGAFQLVVLIDAVESACNENDLVPPVSIIGSDADGNVYDYHYTAELDLLALVQPPPRLPARLCLQDAKGTLIEVQIHANAAADRERTNEQRESEGN